MQPRYGESGHWYCSVLLGELICKPIGSLAQAPLGELKFDTLMRLSMYIYGRLHRKLRCFVIRTGIRRQGTQVPKQSFPSGYLKTLV